MRKHISIFLAITFVSFQLTSCGVMFGGSRFNGTFVADDRPNADIYINGEKVGQGEVTKLIKRDQPLKIELKEEGKETITKNYDNRFRTGNFILSALMWGILGIAVDLGTGASYKPDHVNDASITKVSDKEYKFSIPSEQN